MATDYYIDEETGEPVPDDSEQLDGESALTPQDEQRIQQEIKTQALKNSIVAAQAMKAEEQSLPASLPTQMATPAPRLQPKIYMGPRITPQQFSALPAGNYITAGQPPVLSPDQQMELQSRLARATGPEPDAVALARLRAADQPGSRTISVMTENRPEILAEAARAQRRYDAEQSYRQMIQSGVPAPQAFAQSGMDIFTPNAATISSRYGNRPLTEYQKAQIARWDKPKALTPYQAAQVKRWEGQPNAMELAEFRSLEKQIADARKDLQGRDPNGARAQSIMQDISDLEAKANRIKNKGALESPWTEGKPLTRAKAEEFKRRAKGNRAEAERLAKAEGYTW